MPRKKKIEEAYEGQAQSIEQSAQQTGQEINNAYQTYENLANAAQAQYAQQQAEARAAVVDAQNRYANGVQSIIDEGEARLRRQQEIAQAEYLASQRAAQASGLTHLASSIANLVGVGGFNASNQVYQNPSVEWMRKADQDKQMARARMDNLRERQRQVQQHLLEMQLNGAGQLANMDTQNAQQGYQHGMGLAGARQNADLSASNLHYQAARDAGQARVQGVTAGTQVEMQEAQMAQNAQQHRDSMNMQAARYGLKRNNDGTFSLDPNSEINKLNSATRRSSSGGSKNTYYYTGPDGNIIPVYMTASEYDKFVEQSYAALKDDPDFKKAYDATKFSSGSDLDRKSLIFNYATMNDDRRRVLSQYGPYPEGTGPLTAQAPTPDQGTPNQQYPVFSPATDLKAEIAKRKQ